MGKDEGERTRCDDCGRIAPEGNYLTSTKVARYYTISLPGDWQIEIQLTQDHAVFCGECLDDDWKY